MMGRIRQRSSDLLFSMNPSASRKLQQTRWLLGIFITGLALSGITAFPLLQELNLLVSLLGLEGTPRVGLALAEWILRVRDGLRHTYEAYPFMAYGTDWLAFGHLMIALFFIGPWMDPVRNRWVLQAGLIACACILPLAFICGPLRGIPFYWQLIDCSFGFGGAIPLFLALRLSRQIEAEGR